jgi:hypothetical protein
MLRLNGGPDYSLRLLAASTKRKPTVRVKRLGLDRLKGGSILQNQLLERERDSRKNFEIKRDNYRNVYCFISLKYAGEQLKPLNGR